MTTTPTEFASVRYLVDDVQAAVDFYTTHLGFTVAFRVPPFADVRRGPLPPDRRRPRRRDRPPPRPGLTFRSDLVSGPGGRQILLADPAGNLIELFQPAPSTAAR